MIARLSRPLRTLAAGAFSLSILTGMLVIHAWPLWTGESVVLPVEPVDPRDMFRGEYVRLEMPLTRLVLSPGDGGSPLIAPPGQAAPVVVKPIGAWWADIPPDERYRRLHGRAVYVQLEPGGDRGAHRAVSISLEPVPDRINLRGRIRFIETQGERLHVHYGLDSYFMQEGTAKPVEDAIRQRRNVQMEVAVAASGKARIRRLLIDGVPVTQ